MGTRAIIGPVTAGLMLAVLAVAPGNASHAGRLPVLAVMAPGHGRPSLADRFSGAMTSFHHPVSSAGDHNGFVTVTVAGVDPSQLGELSAAAAAPPIESRSHAAAGSAATRCWREFPDVASRSSHPAPRSHSR